MTHVTPCRNARMQMDLSNNNHFSVEEAINYNPGTEKRKKVPVSEMLDFSVLICVSIVNFEHILHHVIVFIF